jgi:hypothetical protein
VAQDYWRIVSKRIVIDREVGTADPTIAYFNFYLVCTALRFLDVPDLYVPGARRILD